MPSLNTIWAKTAKGVEEVERKVHGLALKSRQVLIMIDGKRDLAAIQSSLPAGMVSEAVACSSKAGSSAKRKA